MAEFTSETVTRTIRRWVVPAADPWGAAAAEIGKAWAAAELAYREHHGIPKEQPLHDDALRFHVRDEEIVISFETEAPQ
ncbi:hypothetical protein [Streptomyces sp. NPDC088812]|uniref:hypothetical protein n=1 Tax=Streptomyces sp. NPDC088812 TaxID=3365905 RepID=UPI003806FDF3